jgi:gluconokinase
MEKLAPVQCVVMGVSGVGKSTVCSALGSALSARVLDGDDLHPPDNVRKMQAGIALQDEDRWGWLESVGRELKTWKHNREHGFVSCSALKRRYRDVLRSISPDCVFIYLQAPKEAVIVRLTSRQGHYMPPSLLDSQFAALEEPTTDEHVITIDASLPVREIIDLVVARLLLK